MTNERLVELAELQPGDNFRVKKGGRGYTFHVYVKENYRDGLPSRMSSGDTYVIAVCQGTFYAFYSNKKVLHEKDRNKD